MSLILAYIATYTVASIATMDRDALIASLAVILCCMFSRSDLFHIASGIQVHLSYSIFYLLLAFHIQSRLTKSTMLFMVLFNFLMAWDCYYNAKTETWLYLNYVTNTSLIHALIVSTLVLRRKNIAIYNNISSYIRSLFGGSINVKCDGQFPSSKAFTRNKEA